MLEEIRTPFCRSHALIVSSVGVGGAKDRCVIPHPPDQHHAYGQAIGYSARHRDGRMAGYFGGTLASVVTAPAGSRAPA